MSEATAPAQMAAAREKLAGLDAIRFVCALWVAISHVGMPSWPGLGQAPWLLQALGKVLVSGPAAVMVFFVVSGFCIHRPYRAVPPRSWGAFWVARYMRILPPLLAAVVIGALLGIPYRAFESTILWSLYAELCYYTAYPLLRAAIMRWGWGPTLGAVLAGAVAVIATNPAAGNYPSFGALTALLGLPAWLLGCRLAAREDFGTVPERRLWAWRLGLWAASAICLALRFKTPIGYPITLTAFAGLVAAWLALEIGHYRTRAPWRVLEWAGAFSYTLYLLHYPGWLVADRLLPHSGLSLLDWSARFALMLVFAYGAYLLVERPSHQAARWLKRQLESGVEWPDRAAMRWLFIAFVCLYALTSGGHFYASDDVQKLAVLEAFFGQGSFAIEGGWMSGIGEKSYSWFPLGASLVMLPGFAIGHWLAGWVPGIPSEFVVRFAVALQNAVISAALVALVFAYTRWLGRGRRASALAALALGLGTMVWPYAKTAWSEPAASLAALGGLFALQRAVAGGLGASRGYLLSAGLALGAAAFIRQEMALVGLGALWWLDRQTRRSPGGGLSWRVLITPLVVLGLASLWYNQVRFGSFWAFPNWSLPQYNLAYEQNRLVLIGQNLYQFLLSPNQGLVWFSPPVLVGFWGLARLRRDRPEAASLWLAAYAPLAVFYVVAWGPSSWAWGMRYAYAFLPPLVAAVAWAEGPRARLAAGALVGLGLAVQLLGVLHNPNVLYERALAVRPGMSIQALMHTPTLNGPALAAAASPELFARTGAALAGPAAADPRAARGEVPDIWPCLTLLLAVPRWLIAACSAALAVGVWLGFWRLWRALAPQAAPPEARAPAA